jgi:hypothetical protein
MLEFVWIIFILLMKREKLKILAKGKFLAIRKYSCVLKNFFHQLKKIKEYE